MRVRKISVTIFCAVILFLWVQLAGAFNYLSPEKSGAVGVNDNQLLQRLDRVKALMKGENWHEAERLARELLEEVETSHGFNTLQTAQVIDVLVESILGDRTREGVEVGSLIERATKIREDALGSEHPELASSLFNFSRLYSQRGDHAASKPLIERSLDIAERIYGPKHNELGRILHHYASLLQGTGDSIKAIDMFRRSLEIKEEEFGSEHLEVSHILNDFGQVLKDTGQLAESKTCFERALAIRKKTLGEGHKDTAAAAVSLGNLLHTMGLYPKALLHYENALPVLEKEFGPEHPETASCLNEMGVLLKDMGNLVEAQKRHERALAIREKSLGANHPDFAHSLNNLGVVLRRLRDFERAKALLERSLAIYEKIYGTEHPKVAMPLVNLSNVLGESGDRKGAEAFSKRAFEIKEKELSPYDMDLLPYLSNRSGNLRQLGRLEEARELQERALMIMEKNLGSDHPNVAYFLTLHANLHEEMGDVKTSLALIERAQAIVEKSLGSGHPFLAHVVIEFAYYLWIDGQIDKALDKALHANTIVRERLHLMSLALSEREVFEFNFSTPNGLSICLSSAVADQHGKKGSASRAWDALIRSRALILDEMAGRNYRIAETSDPKIAALGESFFSARERLAGLVIRGPDPGDSEENYQILLEQVRAEKERSERALAQASASFREVLERNWAGIEEIKSSLPPRSVLVAFAYYYHSEPILKKETQSQTNKKFYQARMDVPAYLAFVFQAEKNEPTVVYLGKADEIHPLVFDWAQEMASGTRVPGRTAAESESAYKTAGSALRRKIWDPIAPHIGDAVCALIVPDGYLHEVNFSALPVDEERYLIEKGPLIHYLSAERDLVSTREQRLSGEGLLVLGNPAFSETSLYAALSEGDEPNKSILSKPLSRAPFRGSSSSSKKFRSMNFEPLPATSREINEITSLWKKKQGRESDVLKLTSDMANETNFKISAPGRQTIHIATHGFFLDSEESLDSDQAHSAALENPLVLTGLVLAGANNRYSAGPEEEDGILTAEEIAALDLRGVGCVVLSGCATASGEIFAGEGVFGLRRAFRLAGARTFVASMSPVEDEATRLWMRHFYDALLGERLGVAESVREASVNLLQRFRRRGKSTHPFYWAGFVSSGDLESRRQNK